MYFLNSDGSTFDLPPGRTGIGRAKDNQMVVLMPLVSRWHAAVYYDGRRCSVVDLGSTHGTMLNGSYLQPQQAYTLRPGDILILAGQVSLAVQEGAPKAISTGIPTGPRSHRPRRGINAFILALLAMTLVLWTALIALVVLYVRGF